jgi:hypothetical protein
MGDLVGGTFGTLVGRTMGALVGGGTKIGSFVGVRTGAVKTGAAGVANGACGALGATGDTTGVAKDALTMERSSTLANSNTAGRTKM